MRIYTDGGDHSPSVRLQQIANDLVVDLQVRGPHQVLAQRARVILDAIENVLDGSRDDPCVAWQLASSSRGLLAVGKHPGDRTAEHRGAIVGGGRVSD